MTIANFINEHMKETIEEARGMTLAELAQKLMVSDKTVSKWETAKGLPDISLLADLRWRSLPQTEGARNSGALVRFRSHFTAFCRTVVKH